MTLDARDAIDTCQLKETDFARLLINVAHANLNVHTSQVLLKKKKKKERKYRTASYAKKTSNRSRSRGETGSRDR